MAVEAQDDASVAMKEMLLKIAEEVDQEGLSDFKIVCKDDQVVHVQLARLKRSGSGFFKRSTEPGFTEAESACLRLGDAPSGGDPDNRPAKPLVLKLCRFLYSGIPELDKSCVLELRELAKLYDVPKLDEACRAWMTDNMDAELALATLRFGQELYDTELGRGSFTRMVLKEGTYNCLVTTYDWSKQLPRAWIEKELRRTSQFLPSQRDSICETYKTLEELGDAYDHFHRIATVVQKLNGSASDWVRASDGESGSVEAEGEEAEGEEAAANDNKDEGWAKDPEFRGLVGAALTFLLSLGLSKADQVWEMLKRQQESQEGVFWPVFLKTLDGVSIEDVSIEDCAQDSARALGPIVSNAFQLSCSYDPHEESTIILRLAVSFIEEFSTHEDAQQRISKEECDKVLRAIPYHKIPARDLQTLVLQHEVLRKSKKVKAAIRALSVQFEWRRDAMHHMFFDPDTVARATTPEAKLTVAAEQARDAALKEVKALREAAAQSREAAFKQVEVLQNAFQTLLDSVGAALPVPK